MEEFVNESIICKGILIILDKFHKKVQVLLLLFKKILCVASNYSLISSNQQKVMRASLKSGLTADFMRILDVEFATVSNRISLAKNQCARWYSTSINIAVKVSFRLRGSFDRSMNIRAADPRLPFCDRRSMIYETRGRLIAAHF